jgi:hypothetical protein
MILKTPAGRLRKPTKLKLITNTLNVSRVNHAEPDVALGMPKPPDHLTDVLERLGGTSLASSPACGFKRSATALRSSAEREGGLPRSNSYRKEAIGPP